jgi:heparinase II/III-like protein
MLRAVSGGLAPDGHAGAPTSISECAARAYVGDEQNAPPADSVQSDSTTRSAKSVSSNPAGPSVNVIRKELLGRRRVNTCSQIFAAPESGNDLSASLLDGLERISYPGFGVCLFKSPRMWLAIRVGGHHLADGGHSHADALSFELHIDGRAYRVDPGSYVYTSLPWRRRQFRSDAAHGIPRLRGHAASEESENIFTPATDGVSTLLALDDSGLAGRRETEQGVVFRVFEIRADAVEVVDLSVDGQPILVEPLPWWSPGYGHLTAFDSGSGHGDSDLPGRRPVERRKDLEPRQSSSLLEQDSRSARRVRHGGDRRSA